MGSPTLEEAPPDVAPRARARSSVGDRPIRARRRPRARTLALAVSALAVLLAAPTLAQSDDGANAVTGDLHLHTNGTLTPAADGQPATCLSISSPGGATQAEETFAANLTRRAYRPATDEVTLLVDLGGNDGQAQAGSGFELTSSLAFGNGTRVDAEPRTFAASSSPDEAIVTFPVPGNATFGRGPLELTVGLQAQDSSIGAPVGQDVDVLCGHEPTRVVSFAYEERGQAVATGPAGDGDDGGPAPGSADPFVVLGASLAGSVGFLAFGLASLTGHEFSQRRIHLMMGLSAGLLLAIALVRLVPASLNATSGAGWTIALGLMGLYSIEFLGGGGHAHQHGHGEDGIEPHHEHGGGAEHEELLSHAGSLALVTFVIFAFHRVVGGLTLPAAFSVGSATGIEAAVGVLIHQAPGGLAAASLFVAGGWEKADAIKGVLVLSLFNPLGALVGLYLTTFGGVIGHLLALSAATFIFVALAEVLPEVQDGRYRWIVAGGFVAGYLLEYAVQWLSTLI